LVIREIDEGMDEGIGRAILKDYVATGVYIYIYIIYIICIIYIVYMYNNKFELV
jgi:hypothetical protein